MSPSSSTFGQHDLTAETLWTWTSIWIIAKRVACHPCRYKDTIFEIGTIESELDDGARIALCGLVAGTAGTVAFGACVDTRGGCVAAVLTSQRVAGRAGWLSAACEERYGRSGGEDE